MVRALVVIGFFVPMFGKTQNCDSIPEINQNIVSLARAAEGKKVGRGECWDLANYTLNATQAEWDGYEVYGKLIDWKNECVYPGDIVQFENVRLRWKKGSVTYGQTMMHHTAIVDAVTSDGNWIILEQNTGEFGKKVGKSLLRLDALYRGKILVYRPQSGT